MKTIIIATIATLTIALNLSCTSQSNKNKEVTQTAESGEVSVYYFHYTRRCATCNAVENISKSTVQELYGEKVTFSSYNLDEETGEEKGKELEISGQSLIIVAGKEKIDITNEAFLFAKTQPDQLKSTIKESIDGFISQ
jgi:cytochrome oxidase Cu insertion factor (SCO1/SenC/PrrC family)